MSSLNNQDIKYLQLCLNYCIISPSGWLKSLAKIQKNYIANFEHVDVPLNRSYY